MYLFLYNDGQIKQVTDNLTKLDVMAIALGEVKVFTLLNKKFVRIVVDEGKLCKVPVAESRILKTNSERLHHP